MKTGFRFLSEVKLELQKVAWPDFNELVGSVIVVFLLLFASAVYLGVIDLCFYRMAEKIF